jgi:predicted transposase/invertase (TIGR01784 family)
MYLMAMVNERDKIETAHNKGWQGGEDAKARKIAKKMLGSGMDIETIATMTGLNPNEITG